MEGTDGLPVGRNKEEVNLQSVLCVGEKQRRRSQSSVRPVRWRETKKKSIFSPSCVLERNKEVKKFPVQKI